VDRSAEWQALVPRRRKEAASDYPLLWKKMMEEWHAPALDDRAWVMYSANYLFRTSGVRWALDPLTLGKRVPGAPAMDVTHDLAELSFVLLTHTHGDHLDPGLVHSLSALPIFWVVPESCWSMVEQAGLSKEKMILPRPMQTIELLDHSITPFEGLHWEIDPANPEEPHGVPALGYLVEFSGKRWLIPGDTRTYDVTRLPYFTDMDGAFVHLWLGRASALLETPPLLESFCTFCRGLRAPRIVVTHLEELGRQAEEYWELRHFDQVKEWFLENCPEISIESAKMGESILL
jgi:hypothetical protein